MVWWIAVCGVVAGFAGAAAGQTVLYGVRENGDYVRINPATGRGYLEGSSGVVSEAMLGQDGFGGRGGSHGAVHTAGGEGEWADRIVSVNRWTGALIAWGTTTGRPPGYRVHGMASPAQSGTLYVLLKGDEPGTPDLLGTIGFAGEYSVIGSTRRMDLEDLAATPSGLVALGAGSLYSINPLTGAASLIGGGGYAGDERGLTYLPGTGLLACGSSLSLVNVATGEATVIGPTGFDRITGLATVTSCYADCDLGGPPPILSINDFICFQWRFAAGDPYANCDGSMTPPVLNVNDFICFMGRWAAGCP